MEMGSYTRAESAAQNCYESNSMGAAFHINLSRQNFRCQEIGPATPLFCQGQWADNVFYIERGLIKLTRLSESGQEVIVGLRSKGALLGAASAIVQKYHPATALTVTSSRVSVISTELLLRLAKTDEQFGWYLHQVHSLEVHQQAAQQASLRCLSASKRLCKLLLQFIPSIPAAEGQMAQFFSPKTPSSIKTPLPLKQWEIAQLIGVTPEHLSRILRRLKQEDLVHLEGGCLTVSDANHLQRLLDE
jgi:CRP-like cAMP-binding protein